MALVVQVRQKKGTVKGTGNSIRLRTWPLHLFLLPSVLLLFVYNYLPMVGTVIAFQNFKPWLGLFRSKFVGLDNFRYIIENQNARQVIFNTLFIASLKIVAGWIIPLIFALMLNEIRMKFYKSTIQTLVYLPHFLSWVIIGGIFVDMLASDGIVNLGLKAAGLHPILFLSNGDWFRFILVSSDIWKEFGFNAIIYLAAIAGVNPSLFEAAEMDGAGQFKKVLHVTIPYILPIAFVLGTLSLGNILNAGFDQVFNLYNPIVYEKGDIIDTFVYRIGLEKGSYSLATAVGLFKSVVGFILISTTYKVAEKYGNYRIF